MDPKIGNGDGAGEPRLTQAYETWTFGRGSLYAELAVPLTQARYIPAIVELPAGITPEALAETSKAGGSQRVLLPVLWGGLALRTTQRTSWPVLLDFGDPYERAPLDARQVNRALRLFGQSVIPSGDPTPPRFVLNAPAVGTTVAASAVALGRKAAIPAKSTHARQGGQLAVMAVIDDGIPFAHRTLMNAAGDSTRVAYCWLQSAAADGTLLFGKEFTRADIDMLRATHGPDEDAIYRSAGALDDVAGSSATLGHAASHGAHVIAAAAGWRDDGLDLDPLQIIAVQLPAAVTIDTAGYSKDGAILSALHYIFARADDIARAELGDADAALPLVINFSYGFTGGPHDGSDPLEIAIAQLVAARKAQGKPTELIMPAGNSFADALSGEIAPAALAGGQPFEIPWRLQPNDASANYLEIWVSASGAAATYVLTLADPKGSPVLASASLAFTVGPGASAVTADLSLSGAIIGEVDIAPFNAAWTRARIALAATEPRNQALPAAPSGRWTVSLTLTGGAAPAGPVCCRIQRDNDPFGYARGARQSYLDDPANVRFTADGAPSRVENAAGAFVRRYGTLNGLATHDQVTVVSSHFADTGRATDYASAGPLTSLAGSPGAVQVSMPADTSTALRGVLGAGTRSGSAIRLSGTSMAAPLYARLVAARFIDSTWPLPPVQPLVVPVSPAELTERPVRLGSALAE